MLILCPGMHNLGPHLPLRTPPFGTSQMAGFLS